MPGLLGFAGPIERGHPEKLLADLVQGLKHETWYQVDLYREEELGLGRVTLGLGIQEPQPLWNEEQSLCIMMEGELYDYGALKQELVAKGHRFRSRSDAEVALHLYEAYGEAFAAKLNGSFVLAIWDSRARKLLIANDRMGSYPLYYATPRGHLIFAGSLHALLADPDLSRATNRLAIAQFLTFDHILDDNTLLQEARLLPQASLLIYQEGKLSLRPYWTMQYAGEYQLQSEESYIEGFLHHLRQAAHRQAYDSLPAGMLLSGGLDSRMLLAVLLDGVIRSPFHTFTWGMPDCDDLRYAREVSAKVGAQHHFFELKPDYLPEIANKGVRLTNGGNCVHFHSLASLQAETRYAQVIYKGVMGDAVMGTALNRHFWGDYPDAVQPQVHFKVHYDRNLLLFTPEEQPSLFTDAFREEVNGGVMASYWQAMQASGATQLADQRNYFDLRQRIPRMTLNGVELVRSQAIVRTPFYDNDLVAFTLQVPPGFRYDRYLTKAALIQSYPELAKVPYTETGLPLRPCVRELGIRANRLLAWHLHRWGIRATPDVPKRPYADYDSWFGTLLHGWVKETLLSREALERGYFWPATIRRLVEEQAAGARHAVRLGALLSLELWHRQFLD